MDKLMGRQAFLVIVAFACLAAPASAQRTDTLQIRSENPFATPQQPPYLRTLTSAREDLEETKDFEQTALVEAAIQRVGGSFLAEDADELEACLVAGKRRIYLSLEAEDSEPSHYGPGQVRHIFGRLFREVETRSFVYDSEKVEQHGGSVVFRADWRYIVLDTDEEVTERLEFKLEEGNNAWRVYEIRSTTR